MNPTPYRGYLIAEAEVFEIFDARTKELIDTAPTFDDAALLIDSWVDGWA